MPNDKTESLKEVDRNRQWDEYLGNTKFENFYSRLDDQSAIVQTSGNG